MDHLRQVRFIVGPFFVLMSLLLGVVFAEGHLLGKCITWQDVHELTAGELAAFGAIVASAVLPTGFFIGGFSVLILRSFFWILRRKDPFEMTLPEETWKQVWSAMNSTASEEDKGNKKQKLYCGTVYQLECFNQGVLIWIERRWNAFHSNMNSIVALIVSFLCGLWVFRIPFSWAWFGTTVFLILVFCCLAWITWRDAMGMTEFQSKRIQAGLMSRPPLASD